MKIHPLVLLWASAQTNWAALGSLLRLSLNKLEIGMTILSILIVFVVLMGKLRADLQITGNVGDTMKESIQIAYTYEIINKSDFKHVNMIVNFTATRRI